MNKSESIAKLAESLAKFQSEVQDPAKNSDNPFFKSKYVELDDLLKATRPVLSKHGLSVLQEPTSVDGQLIGIKTIILHSSGEWIEFEPLVLKVVKVDPQGAGSAITYGRRYSLSSVLGVAWDADDDGNNASAKLQSKATNIKTNTNVSTTIEKPNTPQLMTDMQRKKLFATATEKALSADDMKKIIEWKYKKTSSKELTTIQCGYLIDNLDKLWAEYVESQSKEE